MLHSLFAAFQIDKKLFLSVVHFFEAERFAPQPLSMVFPNQPLRIACSHFKI